MVVDGREQLIQECIERMLGVLPEVVGNLMVAHASNQKLTQDFYAQNMDLKQHRDIVREVIGQVEGKNPTKSYEDILKLSLPQIRDAVHLKINTTNIIPTRESLNLSGDNGAI